MQPNDNQSQALTIAHGGLFATAPSSIFDNVEMFTKYEKMAEALAASSFIPEAFQKKPAECLIALEYAANMGMRPLMVMQNLHVVKGKPSWDGKFIGSVIKACGRFRNMRYVTGQDGVVAEAWVQGAFEQSQKKVTNVPNLTCYVAVIDAATGDEIKGTTVSIQMAVSEGWYSTKGSKWPNMPEQMLQYRAASFFGRIHVQDILLGMHTADEVADFTEYRDAGTGAEEIAGGITLEAPTSGRQQRARRSAPAPTGAPFIVQEVHTPESAGTSWPVTPAEREAADTAAEEIREEHAQNSTPAPAQPAPAPVAAPAPVVTPTPTEVAAPFNMTAAHLAALLRVLDKPVVEDETDRQLIKDFATAYPDFVVLPRTRRGKIEITQAGNEWLAEQPLPAEDATDLEVAIEAHTTPVVTPASPAPVVAVASASVTHKAPETPQETRDRIQAQQYGAQTESAADKFLRERREKEATATAAEVETPEADKVEMPNPLANLF